MLFYVDSQIRLQLRLDLSSKIRPDPTPAGLRKSESGTSLHFNEIKLLKPYLWERDAERRSSLNSWKANLSNTITVRKSKDASSLTERNTFLYTTNCAIELRTMADVVRICKDKCLVNIKADCNYILGIGNCQTMDFINCQVFPQELFIIGELDYQRNIKCILQQSVNQSINQSINHVHQAKAHKNSLDRQESINI